ncbi:MAG: YdeI/OmpD-associated family protein [Caldilineales bacterium]
MSDSSSTTEPAFFATPDEFRDWLEEHHEAASELWVGYYKKDSGLPSITWPESVDEALCFGWIDGLRKSIDEVSYKIRFTPRRPTSNWSAVNIERVAVLTEEGRMRPAGLAAFSRRSEERSRLYSFEREHASLAAEEEDQLRAHPAAWEFFQAQPPSYRKAATHWIVSAKKEATRQSRLARLIEDSANGRTVPPLTRPGKKR